MPDISALSRRRSDQQERLLTTSEAAEQLHVVPRTVLRYIANGVLKAKRLPSGYYRITETAVRECLG